MFYFHLKNAMKCMEAYFCHKKKMKIYYNSNAKVVQNQIQSQSFDVLIPNFKWNNIFKFQSQYNKLSQSYLC